jgi:diguanylate cyclase (GGDEF)-like protein
MEKGTRIAFIGFNPSCGRLLQALAPLRDVEVVGIHAKEVPPDWPSLLDPPPLFSARKDLLRTGAPDILFVIGDEGELKGIPARCQVVYLNDGSAMDRFFETLLASPCREISGEDDVREVASICASVNVVEAYSDPMPKLAQLLDRAMAICGAESGLVLLPGDVLDTLEVVLARGEGAQQLVGKDIRATGSVCGAAFNSGVVQQAELSPEIGEYPYLEGSRVKKLLAFPLRAEGRIIGVFSLGLGTDLDALKMPLMTLVADQAGLAVLISRLYSELETNVVKDSASGLFNQHYFLYELSREVNRARRYSLNVCLVFFEIDDYEGYIKRNGRYMGDFILSDIGNIVMRNTREVDTAARFGENLFAALLPETRRLGAMRFAERIRKVMVEYPFPSREKKEVESLSACVGVSSFPANADNEKELMDRALAALTAAKAAGPNNVRLFSNNLKEETA